MNRRKPCTYAIALALAFALVASVSSAQTTQPFPPPGGPIVDVDIPITAKAADGTTATTTYTIPGAALWALFWQSTQLETNAYSLQNMRQYAQPVCLLGAGADNASSFDWSTNKLRVDGVIYSVTAAGVPYRNAMRLGTTTAVQRLCLYGTDVFAKAKTDGRWYQWKGDVWFVLPASSIDPTVLN